MGKGCIQPAICGALEELALYNVPIDLQQSEMFKLIRILHKIQNPTRLQD